MKKMINISFLLFLFVFLYAREYNLKIVNSIKDLNFLRGIKNECVYVKYYSYENDGGGGIFCYDVKKSHINDGGLIVNGWVRQFSGNVNIKWFGANIYRDDNQIPIERAINSGYKVIIDKGIYKCDNEIKIRDKNVCIEGKGRDSILLFLKNTNGIVIENDKMNYVNISNIAVKTNIISTKNAIKISYVNIPILNRNFSTVHIDNVYISGKDIFSSGWFNGIFLDEATFSIIKNVEIYGRVNKLEKGEKKFWGHSYSGITYLSSTSKSPVNPLFSNIIIKYVKKGFNFRGRMEGIRIINCLVIASKYGVYDNRTEIGNAKITNDPWLYIDGSHFNTGACGVFTKRSYDSFIINSLFYQFKRVDIPYVGIKTMIGNDNSIINNVIIGNKNSKFLNIGIEIYRNNRAKILNNSIIYVKKPIFLNRKKGNSKGILLFNNIIKK